VKGTFIKISGADGAGGAWGLGSDNTQTLYSVGVSFSQTHPGTLTTQALGRATGAIGSRLEGGNNHEAGVFWGDLVRERELAVNWGSVKLQSRCRKTKNWSHC